MRGLDRRRGKPGRRTWRPENPPELSAANAPRSARPYCGRAKTQGYRGTSHSSDRARFAGAPKTLRRPLDTPAHPATHHAQDGPAPRPQRLVRSTAPPRAHSARCALQGHGPTAHRRAHFQLASVDIEYRWGDSPYSLIRLFSDRRQPICIGRLATPDSFKINAL